MVEITTSAAPVTVGGIWLRGGENKMQVLAEVDGEWKVVIDEYVPTHGNDGNVWPISHIVEPSGIRDGAAAE
jgi:hypothetical protein